MMLYKKTHNTIKAQQPYVNSKRKIRKTTTDLSSNSI